MQISDPLNTLAQALHAALIWDLPDQVHQRRGEDVLMRPRREEVDVQLFSQTWGSTALGFDDAIAGQAMSSAYTAVITCGRTACVYFGERLAYTVDTRNPTFGNDLKARDLAAQSAAVARYKAVLPRQTQGKT